MLPGFKSIFDLLKAFPDEQACINHLEHLRWNSNVVSPFDPASKVYKCAKNRYHCKATGKYFNVKTATVFEGSKLPLQKWFMALYLFSSHKKGISSHQLAKDIGITQKSAWFVLHRLRYAFDHPNFQKTLSDNVEVDETYVGGKEKNKHRDKKIAGSQGRSAKGKTPVFGMIQRDGHVTAKVLPDTTQASLEPHILKYIEKGTRVHSDEWHAYNNLHYLYDHVWVNHAGKEYVYNDVTTNRMEDFWSHLKRTIFGIYHHASPRLLFQYVNECTFRFNTRDLKPGERFNLVLENISRRLTYQNLIGN